MTAKYDFTPGEVVQLKSGGPHITYEGSMPTGEAICVWFEGHKVERRAFLHEALVSVQAARRSDGRASSPLVLTNRI